MAVTSIRGFHDILPAEIGWWRQVEEAAARVFAEFSFTEIRTPVLERTELFSRSIGEATDIVEKEMYTFPDRKGESLTLRPEGTASVVRAYLEHNLAAQEQVSRLCYFGPMFRYERPQKGRFRQFYQLGAELIGAAEPLADAEIMLLLSEILRRAGLAEFALKLNSLGCKNCRPAYKEELTRYLKVREADFCPDCRRRMPVNPLRTFDCKVESCKAAVKDAPRINKFLCAECQAHFAAVQEALTLAGAPFVLDPEIMRGLDYYTRTTFEVVAVGLGAQNAVAGGGRYDELIAELGGPSTPAVGFALGMERLVLLLQSQGRELAPPPTVFLCHLGAAAKNEVFRLAAQLRRAGFAVRMEYADKSLKAQLRQADKVKAALALILGENEMARNVLMVKDLKAGKQEEIDRAELLQFLSKRLKPEEEQIAENRFFKL